MDDEVQKFVEYCHCQEGPQSKIHIPGCKIGVEVVAAVRIFESDKSCCLDV